MGAEEALPEAEMNLVKGEQDNHRPLSEQQLAPARLTGQLLGFGSSQSQRTHRTQAEGSLVEHGGASCMVRGIGSKFPTEEGQELIEGRVQKPGVAHAFNLRSLDSESG